MPLYKRSKWCLSSGVDASQDDVPHVMARCLSGKKLGDEGVKFNLSSGVDASQDDVPHVMAHCISGKNLETRVLSLASIFF